MSCYEYDQTAQLYEELYDKHGRLQADLRKLVEEMEAKCPTQSDVVYDHMIHSGRQDVLRAIKELLDGEDE